MPRKTLRKTRRRKMRGGDDVEGVFKRKRGIYFRARPREEYLKIVTDMNTDNEFANKYGARFQYQMIIIKDANDVDVAWIYSVDEKRGYMELDQEVPEIPAELAKDMASVYRRFLKG